MILFFWSILYDILTGGALAVRAVVCCKPHLNLHVILFLAVRLPVLPGIGCAPSMSAQPNISRCCCCCCCCCLPLCRLTASVCCSTAWRVSVRRLRQQQHRAWLCVTLLGAALTRFCGCWWMMLQYSTHGIRCVGWGGERHGVGHGAGQMAGEGDLRQH
jgi:hypothetical protein